METLSDAYEWDRTTEQRVSATGRAHRAPATDDRPFSSDPGRDRLQMSGANLVASWGITIVVLLALLIVSILAPTDTNDGSPITSFDPPAQVGQSNVTADAARP